MAAPRKTTRKPPTSDRKRPAKKAATKPQPEHVLDPSTPATSVSTWKSQVRPYPLRLPSGNVCLVKPNIGPEVFLQSGTVPNVLMPLVEESIRDKQGLPPEKAADLAKNPEMLVAAQEMADSVVVHAVVDPPVSANVPFGMREDDKLYVDELDQEDKWFIFNHVVGGTRDLAKFRQQLQESMESVESQQAVESQAE